MIAKLASQLGSPTLGATKPQLRSLFPTQVRRCIPLYMGCVVLVLLVLNLNMFRSAPVEDIVVVREPQQQPLQRAGAIKEPLPVRSDFPHKIWQTWKVNPLFFEQRDHDVAKTWIEKNRNYRYEVLTDMNEMPFVEFHFGPEGFNRTDIVDFYKTVKAKIVKADLLRYMIMYAEGGTYADIDVEALKPMHKFIPERYEHKDVDMVIGIEIDEPDWKDHPILGPKSRSFCQWTFMCKPRQPVMMRLIEQIMSWLNGVAAKQGVSLADVDLDFDEIISGTGPSAFTNAILAQMNERLPEGEKVTWDAFHDLGESKVVDRVLVLTVEAFAAGQGHSNSGNHDARAALVKHHYHASNWPSRHPRYRHPAYGQVEDCNWNDECVHKWDEDVANFDKLPQEEQKKIIAEKEREREEKRRKEEEEEKKRKEDAERRKKEEEENKRKEEEEARRQKEAEEEQRRKEEDEKRRKEDEERKAAEQPAPPKPEVEAGGENKDAAPPAEPKSDEQRDAPAEPKATTA